MSAGAVAVLACASGVAALLFCERRGWRGGVAVAKPLASSAFLLAALAWGALDATYGWWIFAALAFCWIGDVLLIPRGQGPLFLAGIASFLVGHVVFAGAFVLRASSAIGVAVAALPMLGVAALVLRWLWPHLPEAFRVPVLAYVGVISAMVATALASVGAGADPAIGVGALLFAASDVSVARDRFVAPGFVNGAWGLPLYYAAQLVLASTVRAGL